jgi:hypothetical protein
MWDADYERYQEELKEEYKAQFVTKNSGEKAFHSDGVQRDTDKGKTKYTLMFPLGVPMKEQLIVRVAELYTRGGESYGDRNWEDSSAGDTLTHHQDALWRHFMNFYFAIEDGEDHAAAIVWNINAVEMTRRNLDKDMTTLTPPVISPVPQIQPPGWLPPSWVPSGYNWTPIPPVTTSSGGTTSLPLTLVNAVSSGFMKATDIPWAEDDRLTEADPKLSDPGTWIYSAGGDVWYFEDSTSARNGVDRSARSFQNLIKEFGPLEVTAGEYTGLIFNKNGSVSMAVEDGS